MCTSTNVCLGSVGGTKLFAVFFFTFPCNEIIFANNLMKKLKIVRPNEIHFEPKTCICKSFALLPKDGTSVPQHLNVRCDFVTHDDDDDHTSIRHNLSIFSYCYCIVVLNVCIHDFGTKLKKNSNYF